jgi:hypothetical protein
MVEIHHPYRSMSTEAIERLILIREKRDVKM